MDPNWSRIRSPSISVRHEKTSTTVPAADTAAIAREIGMPLEEAHALEGIGRSHLKDGSRRPAAAHLRQALRIYRRIGSPDAQRVQEILRHYGLLPQAHSTPGGSHRGCARVRSLCGR